MSPEDFLAWTDSLREVANGMRPLNELLAELKRGFMGEGTLGEDAADALVVLFVTRSGIWQQPEIV